MEPTKRFVWWSTDKSVADSVPSVLAALETVVAVGAYWAIAIYFETTTHLWVSIYVAPLLLLRSDQSIAVGARWFSYNLRRAEELDDELGDGLKIRTLAGLVLGRHYNGADRVCTGLLPAHAGMACPVRKLVIVLAQRGGWICSSGIGSSSGSDSRSVPGLDGDSASRSWTIRWGGRRKGCGSFSSSVCRSGRGRGSAIESDSGIESESGHDARCESHIFTYHRSRPLVTDHYDPICCDGVFYVERLLEHSREL
jgi:hypothetical protein